jgi:ABC-type transporter Mla subunit MlaD
MFNAGFTLGFCVALAVVGAVGRIVGAARLARVFGALAGRPVKISQAVKKAAPLSAVPTAVEADVIAALVNLKASGADARRATAEAAQYLRRYKLAPEFDALFNAAVATLRGDKKGVA